MISQLIKLNEHNTFIKYVKSLIVFEQNREESNRFLNIFS